MCLHVNECVCVCLHVSEWVSACAHGGAHAGESAGPVINVHCALV